MESLAHKPFEMMLEIPKKIAQSSPRALMVALRYFSQKLKEISMSGELSYEQFLKITRGNIKALEITKATEQEYKNLFHNKIPFHIAERDGKNYFLFSKQHEEIVSFEVSNQLKEKMKVEDWKENTNAFTQKDEKQGHEEKDISKEEEKSKSQFFEHIDKKEKEFKEVHSKEIENIQGSFAKKDMQFSVYEKEDSYVSILKTTPVNLKFKIEEIEKKCGSLKKALDENKVEETQKPRLAQILNKFKEDIAKEDLLKKSKEKFRAQSRDR